MPQLHDKRDPLWASLRVWAAKLRDSGPQEIVGEANLLVLLLDNYDRFKDNPRLAGSLWRTAHLMAQQVRSRLGDSPQFPVDP
jgi:hypothetical protein